MMKQFSKRGVATLCVAAMLVAGTPAIADSDDAGSYSGEKPTGAEMMADLLIVRPISLVGTIVGTAVFVVSLPFTVPTLSVGDAGRELVVQPGKYTFYRPLGDFNNCGVSRSPCGNR